jgi:hypothetical protein
MKRILLITLLFSNIALTQNLFKDVDYTKCHIQKKYSENYNNIVFDKNAIIIHFSEYGEVGALKKSIVFDKDKIFKIERSLNYLSLKDDYLKIIIVDSDKENDFQNMLDFIINKKYLQNIKQEDLDIIPHKEDYLCIADNGGNSISFFQNNKSYSLFTKNPKDPCNRNQEKLDLFLKLYNLLNDTWNIENGLKGRFIEAKENN